MTQATATVIAAVLAAVLALANIIVMAVLDVIRAIAVALYVTTDSPRLRPPSTVEPDEQQSSSP